jgi:ABC-type dipeptide/oligopeptide/nickel transport system permease component
MVIVVAVLVVNAVVEILYVLIDPRLRTAGR